MSDKMKHVLFFAGVVAVLAIIFVPILRVKFLTLKAKAQAEAEKIKQDLRGK